MTDIHSPGIGHNHGPTLEPGAGWRRHCWKQARKQLLGKRVPVEIVRTRVTRARELGLAYPEYASILMGTGRDIVGFLFTCDAMGLRLRRRLEMPDDVRTRLSGLIRCDRLALAPEAEEPEPFRQELEEISGLHFAGAGPTPGKGWSAARKAVRQALDPLNLPGNAVVLVGTRAVEAQWATAANIARFLPADRYFGTDG